MVCATVEAGAAHRPREGAGMPQLQPAVPNVATLTYPTPSPMTSHGHGCPGLNFTLTDAPEPATSLPSSFLIYEAENANLKD